MKIRDGHFRLTLAALVLVFGAVPVVGTLFPDRFPILEAFGDWQGLVGSLLGLVAAGVAAAYVVMQIRHAQDLENRRVIRSRRAWRATMPEAMSALIGYATDSYDALVQQQAIATTPGGLVDDNNPVSEMPALDAEVLSDIRAMVEVAEDFEGEQYVVLLNDLQVHRARWAGRLRQLARGDNLAAVELEDEMVEASELYARASNLLGVVRPGEPRRELTTRMAALRQMTPAMDPIPSVAAAAQRQDASHPLIFLDLAPQTPAPSWRHLRTSLFARLPRLRIEWPQDRKSNPD